jgi:hypothetical protein
MNTLNRAARLIAIAVAGTVTAALFATVVSFAEPQRSSLIAKNAAQQVVTNDKVTVQVADAALNSL